MYYYIIIMYYVLLYILQSSVGEIVAVTVLCYNDAQRLVPGRTGKQHCAHPHKMTDDRSLVRS